MRRWFLILAMVSGGDALGAGPADGLLKLVPPDAGMTLAVEDLRGHVRQAGGSPLVAGLGRLPAVRAWLESDQARAFGRATKDVEAALRMPIGVIRDELAGDAVVLSLRPGPADKPEEARGLLLGLPRDRSLVEGMMKTLNDAQSRGGELLGVEGRARGEVRYEVRNFRQAGRPAEFYAYLEGGVFAWSNSEDLIVGVIDRKLKAGPGLADDPAFQKVRRGLPGRAVASLFVNPRLVERAMSGSPRAGRPAEDRVAAMIARYVGAVGYAGLAIEWRDGITLHAHEAIDPARLDPWLRRWLTGPRAPAPLAGLVPESALAMASAQVDPEAIRDALWELLPEEERPRMENVRLTLRGLLLGRDPITDVLPRLGPGVVAYLESGPRLAPVAAIGWREGPEDLAGPLDNALRTALGFYALDPKRGAAHLRVESHVVGEERVTSLTDGLSPLLCYRVDHGRVVLGNDPAEVARFGHASPPAYLTGLRARSFPEATTFALVDLGRLVRDVKDLRGPIAARLAARSRRPVEAVDRDLGQLLALGDLFGAIAFTSAAATDATEVHRTLGLIAR